MKLDRAPSGIEERSELASLPSDPTPRPKDDPNWWEGYYLEDVPAVAMAGIEPELARQATDPCPTRTGGLGLGCDLLQYGGAYALSVGMDNTSAGHFILDAPINGTRVFRWQDRLVLISELPEAEDGVRATFATKDDEFAAGRILSLRDRFNEDVRRLGLSWPQATAVFQAARQKEPQE
jgi:hypothetical protein